MRDVIQKIIVTETEAKQLVETAKAKRDQTLSDAQKKADGIMRQTLQDIRAETERIMAAAMEEGEREKQEKLTGIISEIESQIRIDETLKELVVEKIIRSVCSHG